MIFLGVSLVNAQCVNTLFSQSVPYFSPTIDYNKRTFICPEIYQKRKKQVSFLLHTSPKFLSLSSSVVGKRNNTTQFLCGVIIMDQGKPLNIFSLITHSYMSSFSSFGFPLFFPFFSYISLLTSSFHYFTTSKSLSNSKWFSCLIYSLNINLTCLNSLKI